MDEFELLRKHAVILSAIALVSFAQAPAFGQAAVDQPTQQTRVNGPKYSEVRTDVMVKKGPRVSPHSPRPGNFFQLAGAANQELCNDTLKAFNEPGKYQGGDGTRWLLDNSHQLAFHRLGSGGAGDDGTENDIYVFPGLEYASTDINADGSDEHIYRLNSVLRSQWHQRLMIVPDQLQSHPELLTTHAQRCTKIDPSAKCDSINTMIRYSVSARVPDRLAQEWAFTKEGVWNWTTSDAESERLLYKSRNQMARNIGSASGAYWSLYKLNSAVVAVGAPFDDFAPPEFLVFAPSKDRIGMLQCVIMPVAWHERRTEQ